MAPSVVSLAVKYLGYLDLSHACVFFVSMRINSRLNQQHWAKCFNQYETEIITRRFLLGNCTGTGSNLKLCEVFLYTLCQ